MTEWKDIVGFPLYSISNEGEVSSDRTGKILAHNINQAGIPHVGMMYEGKLYRRSVSGLVAQAFLPPPRHPHFDTPTHLDGDKSNNHIENLVWRPRWFTIKYQKQFEEADITWRNMPVEIVKTGEVFEHAIDLCVKYGVLVQDVVHAVHNTNNTVPFGWFEVRTPHK